VWEGRPCGGVRFGGLARAMAFAAFWCFAMLFDAIGNGAVTPTAVRASTPVPVVVPVTGVVVPPVLDSVPPAGAFSSATVSSGVVVSVPPPLPLLLEAQVDLVIVLSSSVTAAVCASGADLPAQQGLRPQDRAVPGRRSAVSISGAPYNYAGDNPLTFGDAVGLLWTPLAGGAGGADAACGATIEIPGVDIGTCGAAGIATGAAAVGAAIGVVTAVAGNEGGDEGEAELKKEAERESCGNPATPPGSKFEWKGKGAVGSGEGSWWDPDADESLYPHLGENSHGPYYDYQGPSGRYRIYPDGEIEPK
jgi:hypothetical protein